MIDEKLRKLKEKHDLEMEEMKLHNEMSMGKDELKSILELKKDESKNTIELQKEESKSKIEMKRLKRKNELLLQKAKFSKEQSQIEEEAFRIKIQSKQNKITIAKGNLLKLVCFVSFIASTCLTISGGYETFNQNNITMFSFLSVTLALQCYVYLSASQESVIKERFFNHIKKLNYLKIASLIISVFHSIKFYLEIDGDNDLFGLPLGIPVKIGMCIVLDYITVYGTAMAHDMTSLNFHNKKSLEEIENNKKPLPAEEFLDFDDKLPAENNKKEKLPASNILDLAKDEKEKEILSYIVEQKELKNSNRLPGMKTLATKFNVANTYIYSLFDMLQRENLIRVNANGSTWVV